MNIELTPEDFKPWDQETRVLLDMFLERGAVADCSKEEPKTEAVAPFFIDSNGNIVALAERAQPSPHLILQLLSAYHLSTIGMRALFVGRMAFTYLHMAAMTSGQGSSLAVWPVGYAGGQLGLHFQGLPVRVHAHDGYAHLGAYPTYTQAQQKAHHELHAKGSVTLQWSRREGKTFFCLRELFDGALDNPGVYVYVCSSRGQLRQYVWSQLGEWMDRELLTATGRDRALISFENGSTLHLAYVPDGIRGHGLRDLEPLRGLRPLGVAMDGVENPEAGFIVRALAAGSPAWFIESSDRRADARVEETLRWRSSGEPLDPAYRPRRR